METRANRAIELVRDRYAERIVDYLERVCAALRDSGVQCDGPCEESVDDYRWTLVCPNHGKPDVIVTFQVIEAQQFGETPRDGINFSVTITAWGGLLLNDLTPYNFTPQVWVPAHDAEAVETRFRIVEQSDVDGIVNTVLAWRAKASAA